jgi:2-keto-4-pentenoate hydratase/2-oxohepta-3-ene-1,7-dioic acid hydratase in catechol pathway
MKTTTVPASLLVATMLGAACAPGAGPLEPVSDAPETPFKLATFEQGGRERVGLVLGNRVFDLESASVAVASRAGLPPMTIPTEMRALIEAYDAVRPRLYQVANYFGPRTSESFPFAFALEEVALKAPIKYPWNLLSAAANYRSHATEMFTPQGGGPAPAAGAGPPRGPNPNAVDPEAEDPVMFAKSPRSTIIDPGEPYFIKAGRNIDWEIELAVVMGRTAYQVPAERAHDYVFGYSIVYDVSDRGGTGEKPLTSMFTGPNWFRGKSRDRAAPFGPYIVPKEFLPNYANLRMVTKVNGVVKQDGNSRDMIWNEGHLIRFLTMIMTLHPGDVIATGTPDGVGTARRPPEYLKPGDVVEMEIEGIGTLTTPMRAAP